MIRKGEREKRDNPRITLITRIITKLKIKFESQVSSFANVGEGVGKTVQIRDKIG